MNTMTDYNLKYRPQEISELDLVSVRERLASILKSETIPHALLLTGPRGTGKTSAARIIAKAINCTKKEKGDFEPCGKCPQCLSITVGNNLDVLEIDAASNRGIDDIRDLREKIKLAPASAKFKVYIIDEVHMLTIEAFNALLKTLEEPPAHAVFILCTTEAEKLPATIISRCMRINFKRGSQKEVVDKLRKIAEGEKMKVEEAALEEIAKSVTGSFRDALRVLEQASFSPSKIGKDEIKEILGQTVGLEPEKLLEALAKRDVKSALGEIDRVMSMGGNLKIYCESLLEILRASLLKKLGVSLGDSEVIELGLEVGEIKRLIEIISKAALELKNAIIPQLPLELAVVEWVGSANAEVGQSFARLQTRLSPAAPPVLGDSAPSDKQKETPSHLAESPSSPHLGEGKEDVSLDDIKSRWQEVLLGIRPKNYSIEALLRSTRPVNFDKKVLTLEVFYQFHKDKLESGKCREVIEETMSEIFRAPFGVRCILGEKPVVQKIVEPGYLSTDTVVFGSNGNGNGNGSAKKINHDGEIIDDDILAVAQEIFGKEVN